MNPRTALVSLVIATVIAAVFVPASAMGLASAELYRTQAYYYGRFDARIRFAPGDGVVSAFFLWKEGSDAANAYWNELDYEKFGADCSIQTNSIYGKPQVQHQQKPAMGFDICAGYHDYRMEWTPTYIAWVVDGKEIRRDTGADATAYSQNASGGMTFHFNIWPGNSSFGGNINNTTLPVHQYISWVQYSSYDNGSFNVQWREEFQSSGVPSGWAVGNWSSPFNLSTHNTQNVGFVNGIAVLSLTADNATGNPGTPPVDNAAGGAGGGGGTGGGGGLGGRSGAGGTTSTGGGSGGTSGSGGTTHTGGSTASGGTTITGGTTGTGGTPASGGTTSRGGSSGTGGTTGAGGTPVAGGSMGSGGTASTVTTGAGGRTSTGGTTSIGGTTGAGGTTAAGGSMGSGSGGTTGTGGTTATGGEPTGGSAGTPTTQSGCSCSTDPAASPSGAALIVLFLVISRLRRKEM
jgi:MYXO-CTERM domain-containing protein